MFHVSKQCLNKVKIFLFNVDTVQAFDKLSNYCFACLNTLLKCLNLSQLGLTQHR